MCGCVREKKGSTYVINLMQSVYEQEQENISTEWRESDFTN